MMFLASIIAARTITRSILDHKMQKKLKRIAELIDWYGLLGSVALTFCALILFYSKQANHSFWIISLMFVAGLMFGESVPKR
jgi:hypothetical protein